MEHVLELRGVQKRFGAAIALAGVDFALRHCEIHALLGENGAGKSTLIKTLAGLLRPDAGSIRVAGQDWPAAATPQDAARAGLRFVHQDLGLVDSLSILDNVALETGYATTALGLIDYRATTTRVAQRLAALGAALDPMRLVGELTQAEKVMVAIARALSGEARIIVLDEVTASLPAPEAQRLHAVIRRTRAQGVAVVFVTHRIEEIFGLCDRATVLADGRQVACAPLAEVDHAQIVRWIVGHDLAPSLPSRPAPASPRAPALPHLANAPDAQPLPQPVRPLANLSTPATPARHPTARLRVQGLAGPGLAAPLDFEVAPGEVLGITGLVGSGYEVVARWLAGLEAPTAGRLELDGQPLSLGHPRPLRRAGFQAISGDRAASAFATLSVRENIFAEAMFGRAGSLRAERERAAELVRRFGIRPGDAAEVPIAALSGGNQQKALFARALEAAPKALLMLDPTAGVDIGARGELYALLARETAAGLAVVLATSDFEEIERHADRALVLASGRPAVLLAGAELRQARLVTEALGAAAPAEAPAAACA